MNVNPISDFFKHTKVIMNADDEPFMIQLTILDELALQTMLQNIMSKSHCKNFRRNYQRFSSTVYAVADQNTNLPKLCYVCSPMKNFLHSQCYIK